MRANEEFTYTLYPNGDAAWMGEYRGPLLAVVYDQEVSTLLKHGTQEAVTRWYENAVAKYKAAGVGDLANAMVLLSFDTRIMGVDWLNRAIACSGTIVREVEAMLHASIMKDLEIDGNAASETK